MTKDRVAGVAGRIGLAGAALQVAYGVAALIYRYPTITDPGFELVWLVVNLGMVASIIGWLAIGPSTSGHSLYVGGAVAGVGHLLRAGIAVWLIVDPAADVDPFIVSSIVLMFGGMIIVGVASLRGRRLERIAAWAPMATVVAGMVTASFYTTDKMVHFVLLGLLWGGTWLALPIIVLRHHNSPSGRPDPAAVGERVPQAWSGSQAGPVKPPGAPGRMGWTDLIWAASRRGRMAGLARGASR